MMSFKMSIYARSGRLGRPGVRDEGSSQGLFVELLYWNTSYIEKAANHLRRERRLPNPNLLRHVSPLGWEHIVLTGDCDWNSGAAERTNARPLNLYPARLRA